MGDYFRSSERQLNECFILAIDKLSLESPAPGFGFIPDSLGFLETGHTSCPFREHNLQTTGHTPTDLIQAVNQLRLDNGLNVLNPHPALMQVAQWEADAIAGGAPGHTRPPGLTLGAWMISLGYPLGGNIALDGYRSENWVAGSELTVDEAIQLWLGDAPHTNTMLSASAVISELEWRWVRIPGARQSIIM